jgi:hypothetical protein
VRFFKSQEEKQELATAEAAFQQFTAALGTADPDGARQLVEAFKANPQIVVLGDKERRQLGEKAFEQYAETVLADDHLTADEEEAFSEVAEAMGLTQAAFEANPIHTRFQVAKLNDGRLPFVESPKLMAKKGEDVHLETTAALMKEVAVHEWRGGSQGVSFRVAKGVRYRVGATRGHLVTVGTELQVADQGVLSITSQRVAYLGDRKTLDMPYARLMGMNLYSDAIQFSLSNRQNAPLFRVSMSTDVLGALINAAMQAAQS